MNNKGQRNSKSVIKNTLRRVQESPLLSSQEDGEEYVCRLCEIPEKPCVDNPLADCPEKILGGTQLQVARDRTRAFVRDETPRCQRCGKPLSARQLDREPLAELCSSCRGRVRKVKRSIHE